ncbi:MAG: tetratricopeptide repeat protein [Lachnospiraceae bacterium]|nr:tetratricopeptide repeat protein [Lachnospiraceae bacterium]
MYDEFLKRNLIRLVQNLRDNKNHNRKEVTLFLGAGCSLSSSEKDITTYGIIRDIVKKYSYEDEIIPEHWSDLYQKFVDNIWQGQGERDRIHLLETYFEDMKPSKGYQLIRFLIENNYINNIITTNFDLMLDEVFKGLSYKLQVGDKEHTMGTNPQFVFLKAHGDLAYGQLRFAPSELYTLPQVIADKIRSLTNGIVIIVGYRAQDMGIIQALSESNEHCAYWITYNEPAWYSDYETGPIRKWLLKRGSEKNLLYGKEYGDFDTIFEKIVHILQDETESQESGLYVLWKKSPIKDYLSLNQRIQQIFKTMLKILEYRLTEYKWEPHLYYYAESHEKLAESFIHLLDDKIIPFPILDCIKNEIDSLIFAISSEIWCLCQGYPVINTTLVKYLRDEYCKNSSNPIINDDFWNIILGLSGVTLKASFECQKPYYEIFISFDKEKDFQVILKRISLQNFSSLSCLMQRIMLFTKTSGEGNDIIGVTQKRILEQALYQIYVHDGKTDILLNKISSTVFQNINEGILKDYFLEQTIGQRHIMVYENVLFVQVDVEMEQKETSNSMFDELCLRSKQLKKSFIDETDREYLIKSETSEIFQKFLSSESSGLFLLGESGIGKTCMLKKLIIDIDESKYIVMPIASNQIEWNEPLFENIFFNNFKESLAFINMMLFQRQQRLLFIIDAINELDMPLQQVISIYKELLELCDFISKENFNNIQMIVTCRTDFYFQIKHNITLIPSQSSFFSIVNENGIESTLYTVKGFEKTDIDKIISYYKLDKNWDMDSLYTKFGYLIRIPVYLDMICKINVGENLDSNLPSEYILYQIWFQNIIHSANLEIISTKCINDILCYIIYTKYFVSNNDKLTTSQLFIGIPEESKDIVKTYEWLINHGVLKKASQNKNLVFFSHDKIEEFIFTQYILDNYGLNLCKAIADLKDNQHGSMLIRQSICTLLQISYIKNEEAFKETIVEIINENNDSLVQSLIYLLIENPSVFYQNLYDFLRNVEQYISKAKYENFIYLIYAFIEDRVDNYQFFSIEAIDCMNKFINHSNIGNSLLIQALNYYNYANYIWKFPIEHDEKNYEFAIQQCKNFQALDMSSLPPALIDKNNYLLAILMRNKGDLNEAVDLMENVYQNLYSNACFNEACQALLELGAIFRELTKFDKALELYNQFDSTLLNNELLKYRLCMNTGIIYKNKVQNDLFNKSITSKTIENYHLSSNLFKKVYIYAKSTNHIPLQLEIIAELIESTVTGYYLDFTTISDAMVFAKEMDSILPKYPVPVRKIQACRMWARILAMQGEILEAIKRLQEGFSIAVHYNIPFRAADCCNQISGILCDNINKEFITQDLLKEGIKACQYSIDYYTQLNQEEHEYLNDSYQKLNRLQSALKY